MRPQTIPAVDFSILQGLPDEVLSAVWSLVRFQTFPRSDIIFHTGDPATAIYLLVEGVVKVTYGNSGGDEATIIVFQPGDTFGDLFLGKYRFRVGTATTLSDTTVAVLREEDFLALVGQYPAFAVRVIQYFADRSRETLARMHALMHVDARTRLLGVLLNLSRHLCCEVTGLFTMPTGITQSVLAEMACLNRSTVNQLIAQLRDSGVVTGSGRQLSVHVASVRALLAEAGAEILE